VALPINKRDFDVFLSHAHVDKQFVDALYAWLTEAAGMKVWYDAKQMGGQGILHGLKQGIENSRGAIIVASEEAISRGWVRHEVDIAADERNRSREFRLILLRMQGANVDDLIRGLAWIDAPHAELTPGVASAILFAFHSAESWPDPATSRDVYVSASWRKGDNQSALAVCRRAAQAGFRLIGDSTTQQGFSGDRVQNIIASCGAAVVVIPYRDCDTARPDDGPYKYFMRELGLARSLDLPTLVVADPRVNADDGNERGWHRLLTDANECPKDVEDAIDGLWDDWREPPQGHFVFYATDLKANAARAASDVRRLIELVTGMPLRVGRDAQVHGRSVQSAIVDQIRSAFLVVADISGKDKGSFNLDVCIEAGMALALGRNLRLMASGDSRRPPFMLRDSSQLVTYGDAIEQIGQVRRLAWAFRRRVINTEL
jgi:hypothetical protein